MASPILPPPPLSISAAATLAQASGIPSGPLSILPMPSRPPGATPHPHRLTSANSQPVPNPVHLIPPALNRQGPFCWLWLLLSLVMVT